MINSLKRLFGGKPAFQLIQSATGTAGDDKPVVLLSAALHVKSGQDAMVLALFEQFKIQRMLSPAETDLLLITVSGECDSPKFIESWRAHVSKDPVATAFMSRMTKADLGNTKTQSYHSLLLNEH